MFTKNRSNRVQFWGCTTRVHVDLDRDTVAHSPKYDPSAPVNLEYEVRLYDYYGRPKYWTRV